jgi:hypothetical protein
MEEDVKIRIKEELKAAKARLKAAKLLLEKGHVRRCCKQGLLRFLPRSQSHAQHIRIRCKNPLRPNFGFGLRIVKTKMLDKKFAQYFRSLRNEGKAATTK